MNGCKLHVANIIHYLQHGGGVAIQALNIARQIHSLDVSTSFSTLLSKTMDKTCENLINQYPGKVDYSRSTGIFLDSIVLWKNLKSALQENCPNVIQAYDPLVSGLAAYLVKRQRSETPLAIRLGTTYLTHFAFQFNLANSNSLKEKFTRASKQLLLPVLSLIEKTTLQAADAVVANCEYLKEVYKNLYPNLKQITMIRNGVDTTVFTPNGPRNHLENSKLNLLYVGRIEERKGLDYLLHVMARVLKKQPNCRLSIVGRAPNPHYKAHLEKIALNLSISSKIKFTAAVDNQKIPQLMRSADILVFPSTTHGEEVEGLPNSVLEGLASGLPVVATKICGVPEVIEHGKNGLLVSPGSIEELEYSIDNLLNSRSFREELGTAARKYIMANNSIEHAAKKYLSLYHHLIERKYEVANREFILDK